jgi:23S rRNA pseudouridine1911/1915/1917 synthase
MKYIITSENVNERLDKFLTSKMSDFSRSQIQKMIKNGEVMVNGAKPSVHRFLKNNDEIEILKYKSLSAIVPMNIGTKADKKLPKFRIVDETTDYVIIEKPAGVIVHGGQGIKESTLVDALLVKYPEIKKIKDLPAVVQHGCRNVEVDGAKADKRHGIVHRIDKEVSGIMVVARNQKSFDDLKKQFKKRKIKKVYFALVDGIFENEEGLISTPLQKNKEGLMTARTDAKNKQAKTALTNFEVIKKFKNHTLLKVQIHTGRTHQIRVHMKSIGHSIVGDKLYATKSHYGAIIKRRISDREKLGRIFLHATELGFFDLTKKWQEYKINLPKELKKFLEGIK